MNYYRSNEVIIKTSDNSSRPYTRTITKRQHPNYCSNEVRTKKWHWYVYILECLDGLYYTGMTWNIDIRLEQHALGLGSKFTSKHGFKRIRYLEEFDDITAAREREIQLKDFSRRKKEALWTD